MAGAAKNLNPNVPGSNANQFATGKRVYNGASPSPHNGKGGVNPAGYQARDQKANVKRQMLMQMLVKKGK